MAFLNLGVGVLLATIFMGQAEDMKDMPPLFHVFRMALLGLAVVFAAAYAAMPFLPRRPSVWIYGIVLLGLAATNLITLPISVAMIFF